MQTMMMSAPGDAPRPLLLRARDLALALAVSEASVWAWRRYGDVPAFAVGTAVRFRIEDVLAWVASGGPVRASDRRREILAERAASPDKMRHPGGRPRRRTARRDRA
jgi:predicted DNA-binding transcriptional regulator AlpA